jgi:hypothetical protein
MKTNARDKIVQETRANKHQTDLRAPRSLTQRKRADHCTRRLMHIARHTTQYQTSVDQSLDRATPKYSFSKNCEHTARCSSMTANLR